MEVTIPAKSVPTNSPVAIFENFEAIDLERMLEEAPSEVIYDPTAEDFILKNSALTLKYEPFTFLDYANPRKSFSTHLVTLTFQSTEKSPPILIYGETKNMDRSEKNLHCNDLSIWAGWDYMKQTGNLPMQTSYRHHQDLGIRGQPEWFAKGDNLLRRAAQKYHLSDWYKVWRGDLSLELVGIQQPTAMQRLVERVKGYLPLR